MPPPVRKLNLEDNSILQACGGVGAFRKSYRVEELKRDYHETLASLRQLGAAGAADLHEHGYMLIELPKWLGKLLGPFEVASYITEAGGPRSMATLNGKSLLARPEPRDNSYAFSEAAAGLAACARLVATALLGHRQGDILTPATTELLQPVASAYEHASAAHINLYEQHLHEQQQQQQQDSGDGRTSAYSPHVDGGLLTLVACPVRDGCLVVLRPGGGREHVPLEPGVAAVLPGLSLGQDPYPCNVPSFTVPYTPTVHWVDRSAVMAQDRASVTFHLRPHPDAVLLVRNDGSSGSSSSRTQTARAFLEGFYGSTDRINNAAAAAPRSPTFRTVPPANAVRPAPAAATGAAAAAAGGGGGGGGMSVFIKTMTGNTLLCGPLYPWSTVAHIKTLINEKEGIPEDQIKLIFRKVQLEVERTLESYDITDRAVMHLLLKLTGD